MGAKIALGILAAVKGGTLDTAYELVKLRTSIPLNVDAIFAPRKVTPKAEPSAPDADWSEIESEPPPPPPPVPASAHPTEPAPPKAITYDRDLAVARLFFLRREVASHRRLDGENVEEVRRHHHTVQTFRPTISR